MLGLTLLLSCRLPLKLPSSTEIEDDPEMDRDTKVWPPYYLDTDKYNTIRPRPDLVLIVRRPDRFDLGFRIRQRTPQNYPSLQQIYLKFDVGLSIAKRELTLFTMRSVVTHTTATPTPTTGSSTCSSATFSPVLGSGSLWQLPT